jgi:hypothetical protein
MRAWHLWTLGAFAVTLAGELALVREDELSLKTRVAIAAWTALVVGMCAFALTRPTQDSGRLYGPYSLSMRHQATTPTSMYTTPSPSIPVSYTAPNPLA